MNAVALTAASPMALLRTSDALASAGECAEGAPRNPNLRLRTSLGFVVATKK